LLKSLFDQRLAAPLPFLTLYCGVDFTPVSARAWLSYCSPSIVAIKSSSGQARWHCGAALTSAAKTLSDDRR